MDTGKSRHQIAPVYYYNTKPAKGKILVLNGKQSVCSPTNERTAQLQITEIGRVLHVHTIRSAPELWGIM